jgi:hypothetical protein
MEKVKRFKSNFSNPTGRIVGLVKIYVAAVEVLRKKERQNETQFTTKIAEKTSMGPSYFVL